MIHRTIYQYGIKFRNPSLNSQLKRLSESDKFSYSELQGIQLSRLKDLVAFAYQNSPFYHQLMDKISLSIDDIQSLKDIEKLPVIGKSDLIAHKDKIQSRAKFNKLVFSETSGTTGQPLTIYRSEEWDSATRAAMFRGMRWYGVSPWEKKWLSVGI